LRAYDFGQRAPSANFITPGRRIAGGAANPYGADELIAVDNDRQSTPLREIPVRILPQLGGAAGQHLVHGPLARQARVQHGACLHDGGVDGDLGLAVHAVEIDHFAELIVNRNTDLHALCGATGDVAAQQPSALVIQGGTLVDGNGGPPLANALIVIQGNRIAAVGAAGQVQIPAGAQVINATGKWITPGLIDAKANWNWMYGKPSCIGASPPRW
jgi:hypothetical protein